MAVGAQKGVHIVDTGNEALPVDLVKLLKTQDVKYLQNQRLAEQKVGLAKQCFHWLILKSTRLTENQAITRRVDIYARPRRRNR